MKELLKKANNLHKEFNEDLEKKLRYLDECIEKGEEYSDEEIDCSVDLEKLEKLDELYETIIKKL